MDNILATTDSSTATANNTYNQLLASIQSQHPKESIRRLKEFLQTYPSFAQGHNDLSVLLLQNGSQTLALAHQEKACRLQPDNVNFQKNLADFYAVRLGWYDDAIDIYLDILRKNPRDTEALIALGQLGTAMKSGAYLDSSAYYEIEAPATPNLPQPPSIPPSPQSLFTFDEIYRNALELASTGDLGEAVKQLEDLAKQRPENAVIQNDLGVLYYKQNDIISAQQYYEKAVQLDPGSVTFARNLADLYFTELGRKDEAIKIYLDLHKKAPRDIETLINLGHICTSVGRPTEAQTFYRRVLEIEPWHTEARELLSALNEQQTQPSPELNAAPEQLHAEALQAAKENRNDDAVSLLRDLVRLFPNHAIGQNDLGVLLHRVGNNTAAAEAYKRAIDLLPDNLNFRKNLADLYFIELGQVDEAIQMYLELFRKQPRDIEILLTLGQICTAVGRPAEAKTFLKRALEVEPWNTDVRLILQELD